MNGKAQIEQTERELNVGPLVHQPVVLELLLARLGELFDHRRVNQPVNVEIAVVEVLQLGRGRV